MKLCVSRCGSCGQKIPLSIEASNRTAIRRTYGVKFSVECSSCYNTHLYRATDIHAESNSSGALSGGVLGGAIGLLGGPIGAVIGGAIGAGIGNEQDSSERMKVERFNRSH